MRVQREKNIEEARRWPSASQEGRPQQKTNLPTASSLSVFQLFTCCSWERVEINANTQQHFVQINEYIQSIVLTGTPIFSS